MADINIVKERKTLWVVVITATTMVVEIIFGITTRSMALLADGIHMGSHVLAIGISWGTYVFIRKVSKNNTFRGNLNKLLSLSGYSSGLILLFFAVYIIIEAIYRFLNPQQIRFGEAILVAFIGLVVNMVSAALLHHKEKQSDHNIRAAYLHVIADALTSISAIIGLCFAMLWNITLIDTVAALASSVVIIVWSVGLMKEAGKILLDIDNKQIFH